MNSSGRSQAFLRKRKMMLVLPVIMLPFITMAFWALGGGKDSQAKATMSIAGLNLNLPDANLKDDKGENKLSFYEQADKDSLKLLERQRNDPFYHPAPDSSLSSVNEIKQMTMASAGKYHQKLNTSPYGSMGVSPEQKLMEQLAQLQNQLNTPKQQSFKEEREDPTTMVNDDEFSEQVSKLEQMVTGMNSGGGEDPELRQLDGTLDKILDIQHPGRVKERLREQSL